MKAEKRAAPEEIRQLDEKDRRILNILEENARAKLTYIAKHVQLSVDSTKKRIEKLEQDGVITKHTIQVDDRMIGLPFGVHVYLKLKNLTEERYNEFIGEMRKNPRVIVLISMLGDYDIYMVMISRNAQELDRMKLEIRQKFTELIDDWKEVIVARIFKLEEYRF